ncbi:MAG: cyclase family protein, partial [Bdellovibrionales bacterium]|nr:cyclase family protein [Bdellovibrionales bacterium]
MLKATDEEAKKIWDISPLLESRTAVWPGDVAFSSQKSLRIQDGQNIDLGSMSTTFHVGAHADAPSHYAGDGVAIEAVDLIPYIGGCQVVDVSAKV